MSVLEPIYEVISKYGVSETGTSLGCMNLGYEELN